MLRRVFVFGSMLLVFLTIAILPAVPQAVNFPPEVSNVYAEQRPGTKVVDITYDVDDPDLGDVLTISVAVSDDGGSTFTVPARRLYGDVWRGDDGLGISPGPGKQITWYAGVDAPDILGTNFRVKVTASDAGMVLIPAGPFLMGDVFAEGETRELPVHEVYLDDFYMDACEVTNAQYKEFIDFTGHTAPVPDHWSGGTYPAGEEDHPVINVSRFEAANYARWAGKRLPTEAEWEKAARGGLVGRRYPWGDSISAAEANYDQNIGNTTPVGNYPPNGYGLYDVAGNVWEWCADWYDEAYYSSSPDTNPQGPASGTLGVVRGGGWYVDAYPLRVAHRRSNDPTLSDGSLGFRCAGNVIP